MVSYRFCRPDDLPLLVRAINECYDRDFRGRPKTTLDDFRRDMRELDYWPSNCMVAMGSEGPVGVSVATKRKQEVLIAMVGVLPQDQGEGHGRHLVTSLRQKLAVLGPERLVAEVSRNDDVSIGFLGAIGFCKEVELWDWERPRGREVPPSELFGAISVVDLEELDALSADPGIAWGRQIESLRGRAASLKGYAVAPSGRIEGWVLFRSTGPVTEVLGWGGEARPPTKVRLFDLLCRRVEAATRGPIRLPKLMASESDDLGLIALGFKQAAGYYRFSGEAIPA